MHHIPYLQLYVYFYKFHIQCNNTTHCVCGILIIFINSHFMVSTMKPYLHNISSSLEFSQSEPCAWIPAKTNASVLGICEIYLTLHVQPIHNSKCYWTPTWNTRFRYHFSSFHMPKVEFKSLMQIIRVKINVWSRFVLI